MYIISSQADLYKRYSYAFRYCYIEPLIIVLIQSISMSRIVKSLLILHVSLQLEGNQR